MKKSKKRLNFIVALMALVSPFVIHTFYIGGIGSFFFAAISMDDTQYAEKYSYNAWKAVHAGINKQKIIKILGQPLTIWERKGRTIWSYTKSPGDTHYHMRQLEINKVGVLINKIGYYYLD